MSACLCARLEKAVSYNSFDVFGKIAQMSGRFWYDDRTKSLMLLFLLPCFNRCMRMERNPLLGWRISPLIRSTSSRCSAWTERKSVNLWWDLREPVSIWGWRWPVQVFLEYFESRFYPEIKKFSQHHTQTHTHCIEIFSFITYFVWHIMLCLSFFLLEMEWTSFPDFTSLWFHPVSSL